MSKDIYLLLADGTAYKGKSFGAEGETLGEVVFSTGMVGYLETLTDPCYYGQIVVQTFPLIGNYGMADDDYETQTPTIGAMIVREYNDFPSNFRSAATLDAVMNLVYFGAFLALNLGIMNLLPIPALDGGRATGLLITTAAEKITGKKINPKYEAYLHGAGMILLLILMAVLMFKDIFVIIKG